MEQFLITHAKLFYKFFLHLFMLYVSYFMVAGEDLDNSSEYDEEEEEEDDDRPRKKKKKDRFGGFIIDEAEVDDEVEDDDEWEEGAQEIGIVGNEVDELGPTAREIEGRRRGTNLWE